MVSQILNSGSFGGVSANNAVSSSLAQHQFSRFSLAFSDTASRFIGDLRQFHLPLYSSAELDDRMQATLASKAFFCNPRLGARLSHP